MANSVINRSNIAAQLVPGLNKVFGVSYKDIDQEHKDLFEIENSNRAFEEEVMWTGLGTAPDKSEGAAVTFDDMRESYKARWTHKTIALAFAITEEAIEDNLYDTFSKTKAKALGRALATTLQIDAANVFNNGFSAGNYAGGDGVALFSASHPTIGAGNLSNTVSSDLSEAALENAMIALMAFQDDRGIIISAQAKSLHIPRQLVFTADRILFSDKRVGTADNDANSLRRLNYLPAGVICNHRFTDSNAWFIKTDVPDGTKMFNRVPVSTKMDGDFFTGNAMWKARQRYSLYWANWRGWYGSNGSS